MTNLRDSVGLILPKTSVMWVTILIDLSTWSFTPLPRFFNTRRVPPLLNQSLVGTQPWTIPLLSHRVLGQPERKSRHHPRQDCTFTCQFEY